MRGSAEYRQEFNTQLDAAVSTLAVEAISISLYRYDIFGLFYRLAANPEDVGFVNISDASQAKTVDADQYLFWDDIHPTTAGHYQIASAAFDVLTGPALPPAQPLNLSARLAVGIDENVLIGGLIVSGTEAKQVIVRGFGPSIALNGLPITGALADPVLELYQDGALITRNDNWKETQQDEIEASGLAPENELESAIIVSLAPAPTRSFSMGGITALASASLRLMTSPPRPSPRSPIRARAVLCKPMMMFSSLASSSEAAETIPCSLGQSVRRSPPPA